MEIQRERKREKDIERRRQSDRETKIDQMRL